MKFSGDGDDPHYIDNYGYQDFGTREIRGREKVSVEEYDDELTATQMRDVASRLDDLIRKHDKSTSKVKDYSWRDECAKFKQLFDKEKQDHLASLKKLQDAAVTMDKLQGELVTARRSEGHQLDDNARLLKKVDLLNAHIGLLEGTAATNKTRRKIRRG